MIQIHSNVSDNSLRLGYEPEQTRSIAFAIGACLFLLSLVVIGLFVSWLILAYFNTTRTFIPGLTSAHPPVATGPGVLDDIAAIRARLEHQQLEALAQTGWVDRDAGIARISLSQAMRQIAAHGLPHFAPTTQPNASQRHGSATQSNDTDRPLHSPASTEPQTDGSSSGNSATPRPHEGLSQP